MGPVEIGYPSLRLRSWDEDAGVLGAAMAGAAGDRVGVHAVGHFGEVLVVQISRHVDHVAGDFLGGVFVGRVVDLVWIVVAFVAELTLYAKVAAILLHDLVDLVAGRLGRENLQVLGLWQRFAGLGRSLGGRKADGDEGCGEQGEGARGESGHGVRFLSRLT